MAESIPQESSRDDLHRVARAALSTIPIVGGAAVELFNHLLAPPIQRRRDAWLNDLAQRLAKLEQEGRVKIEDLQHSDEFISTVMQASQVAVRNHQKEKLDALRNAVMNTAIGQAPDDAKREMFLAFIDDFTVWHLKVLAFLNAPDGWARQHGLHMQQNVVCHTVEAALYNQFAELYREPDFRKALIRDLRSRSLIQSDDSDFEFCAASGGRRTPATTPLGRDFLRFISEPEGEQHDI